VHKTAILEKTLAQTSTARTAYEQSLRGRGKEGTTVADPGEIKTNVTAAALLVSKLFFTDKLAMQPLLEKAVRVNLGG
jgi:hypothetical protein